jgi:hypothetical protein
LAWQLTQCIPTCHAHAPCLDVSKLLLLVLSSTPFASNPEAACIKQGASRLRRYPAWHSCFISLLHVGLSLEPSASVAVALVRASLPRCCCACVLSGAAGWVDHDQPRGVHAGLVSWRAGTCGGTAGEDFWAKFITGSLLLRLEYLRVLLGVRGCNCVERGNTQVYAGLVVPSCLGYMQALQARTIL